MPPEDETPRHGSPDTRWGWASHFLGWVGPYDVWLKDTDPERWIWIDRDCRLTMPVGRVPFNLTPHDLCKYHQLREKYTDGIPPATHKGDTTDD